MSYPKEITVREVKLGTIRFDSAEEYKEWLTDQQDGNHQWDITFYTSEQEFYHADGSDVDLEDS